MPSNNTLLSVDPYVNEEEEDDYTPPVLDLPAVPSTDGLQAVEEVASEDEYVPPVIGDYVSSSEEVPVEDDYTPPVLDLPDAGMRQYKQASSTDEQVTEDAPISDDASQPTDDPVLADNYKFDRPASTEPTTDDRYSKIVIDPEKMRIIRRAFYTLNGTKQQEGQSDEDFAADFATHMRWSKSNIGTAGRDTYNLYGADEDNAKLVGAAMRVFEEDVPNISDQSVLSALSSIKDYALAGVLDPTNLFSAAAAIATGGVGGAATKILLKEVTEAALKAYVRKRVMKQAAWVGVVEGAGSGGIELANQAAERAAYIDPKTGIYDPTSDRNKLEYDIGDIALQTGVGAVLGGGTTALGAKKVFMKKLDTAKEFYNLKPVKEAAVVDPYRGSLHDINVKEAASYGDKEAINLLKRVEEFRAGVDPSPDAGIGGPVERLLKQVADVEMLGEEAQEAVLRQHLAAASYHIASSSQQVLMDQMKTARAVGLAFDPQADVIFNATLKYSEAAKTNKPLMHAVADFIKDIAGGDTVHWDKVNVDTLERVLSTANISTDTFVTMAQILKHNPGLLESSFKEGMSKMGRGLAGEGGAASQAGKTAKRFTLVPDELSKALGVHLEKYEPSAKEARGWWHRAKWLTQNKVALLTSGFATTVRNVLGSAGSLTFGTAAAALENAYIYGGRALQKGQTKQALGDWYRDTFAVVGALVNDTKTRSMFEEILSGNPKLSQAVVRQMQEAGADEVSKLVRMANHFNIVTDGFYRRARFVAEVNRTLIRTQSDASIKNPISLEKFVASGMKMDSKHLRKAVDASLKDTFAYTPNKEAHGIGKALIDAVNKTSPISSMAVPFPRFMYNALAWQMRYSPVDPIVKFTQAGIATALRREVSHTKEQFAKSVAEGTIGTIALGGAMWYRSQHLDTEWYDLDGQDARSLFPFAQYLAVADLAIKWHSRDKEGNGPALKSWETLKTVIGINSRSGLQPIILDRVFDAIASEDSTDENTGEAIGKFFGELLGGTLAIPRTVKDIVSIVDKEMAYARDSNILESSGSVERGKEMFWNTIKKNFPGGDLDQPIAHTGLTSGPRVSGGLIKQLTGAATMPRESEVAKEYLRLGLTEFEVIPASGEPIVDDYINQNLAPAIEVVGSQLLKDPTYLELPDADKKTRLNERVRFLKRHAREYAELHAAAAAVDKAEKLQTEFDNYKANSSDIRRDKNSILNKELELIRARYNEYTGPFARATWLGATKEYRALADLEMKKYKERLQRYVFENNDYAPTDLEKLVLYGKGNTTENLGLYGIGAAIAKDLQSIRKPK